MSIDLHELRRLAAAATPGPWWWGGSVDHHGDVGLRGRRPGLGVVDVLRTTPEDVDEESAGREWDTTDVSHYYARDEWIEMRVDHPHRYLAFLRNDDLFVEAGRDKAVFEVARNRGLPDDTPRDHPQVYRGDVVAIRNANAEYIAAASPDVLLDLLDRLDQAEHAAATILDARPARPVVDRDAVLARLERALGLVSERSGDAVTGVAGRDELAMACPGCDCDPVGYAPHNGLGDCPPRSAGPCEPPLEGAS